MAKKDKITQEDIDVLHTLFIDEMVRLFNRSKERNGVGKDVRLGILEQYFRTLQVTGPTIIAPIEPLHYHAGYGPRLLSS